MCGAAAVCNVLLAYGFGRSLASRRMGATVRKGGADAPGPSRCGGGQGLFSGVRNLQRRLLVCDAARVHTDFRRISASAGFRCVRRAPQRKLALQQHAHMAWDDSPCSAPLLSSMEQRITLCFVLPHSPAAERFTSHACIKLQMLVLHAGHGPPLGLEAHVDHGWPEWTPMALHDLRVCMSCISCTAPHQQPASSTSATVQRQPAAAGHGVVCVTVV